MKSTLAKTAMGIALVLIVITALQVLAQPRPGGAPPAGGAPGGGFPGMMMGPGWPPAPTPVVVVSDGVVYVACDGKLMAFEAKTLKVLGEATYWERPAPEQ